MTLNQIIKHLSCMRLDIFHLHSPCLFRCFPLEVRFLNIGSAFETRRRRVEFRPFYYAVLSTKSYSNYSLRNSVEIPENDTYSYLCARICFPKDAVDLFLEALLCFGAVSANLDESDSHDPTDKVCISAIFPVGEDVAMCISRAADSIDSKVIPSYTIRMGMQCDWINTIQESFHPVKVTEGLWIVPEWRTPPDVEATNIILNPGLTFGTGDHPTTNLCLKLLHSLIKGGEKFLDYGTGSGILAIAALKFGAALSVGLDIDPVAIRTAHQNATLNNISSDRVQFNLIPDKTCLPIEDLKFTSGTEKYDLVFANILLNPLLHLADHIVSYAKPHALVAISGILSDQLLCVMERYGQLLDEISVLEMDGWICASGKKTLKSDTKDLSSMALALQKQHTNVSAAVH